MTRDELTEMKDYLMDEWSRRRKLGDYSQDAAGIRYLYECMFKLIDYTLDKDRPRVKK